MGIWLRSDGIWLQIGHIDVTFMIFLAFTKRSCDTSRLDFFKKPTG